MTSQNELVELLESKAYDQLIKKAKAKLNKDPKNQEVLNLLGYGYAFSNHTDEALEVFKKLQKLAPNDEQIDKTIGHLYSAKKKYEKALSYYEKVLIKEPKETGVLSLVVRFLSDINFNLTPEKSKSLTYLLETQINGSQLDEECQKAYQTLQLFNKKYAEYPTAKIFQDRIFWKESH